MNFRIVGYVATSTLITIGSVLWYDRTDNRIQPQDVAELMNAVQERCLATRFMTNGPNAQPVISDGGQFSIVKVSDDTHSFYAGTNPVPYSVTTLVPVAPYTNTTTLNNGWQWGPGTLDDYISYNAITIAKTYTENDPTNRWILGTYESFIVSGFPESDFNGTYSRTYGAWQASDKTWFVIERGYTNSTGCFMEPGETRTDFWRGDRNSWEDSYYSMWAPPWFNSPVSDEAWIHDPIYAPFNITCTKGPLATNILISATETNIVPVKITDRPCYRKTYVNDWVIDNRIPSWDDLLGQIDKNMWGGFNGWFLGWLYSPWLRPALTQSVGSVYGNFYDHAFYIDPEKWGVSTFTNVSTLEIPIDSWGLTNTVDMGEAPNTVKATGFDDAIYLPLGYNQAQGFTFSPSHNRITKHALDQRRSALQQCTVLRAHGGTYHWVPPSTNNVRWSGNAYSTNSYADACAKAKAACTNVATESGFPYSWTIAERSGDTYGGQIAYWVSMKSRDAKLVCFFDTNNQNEVSIYLRGATCSYNQPNRTPPHATNRFFANDSTITLTTNVFTLIDSTSKATRSAYSNLVVSFNNDIFPPAPATNVHAGGNTMISWGLEDYQNTEIITKWDFQYCRP